MELGSMLLAALGIGLLIFIHELGHFLAARLAGVRVEVFSLGFGPRIFGKVWQGTDFRLSLVPFGGFVMVAGQDPTDRRYPPEQSLYSKSVGMRALFWTGGVLMNALFALLVFPLVFQAGVSFLAPVVGSVRVGGAAWEADMHEGDRILSVAGKAMYSFENLAVEVALHGNRPVSLLVRGADNQERTVTTTPHFDREAGLYDLGIAPSYVAQVPVLHIEADSPAARAGLRNGDTLLAINGTATSTPDFDAAVAQLDGRSNSPIQVLVQRDGNEVAATVQPTPHVEPSKPLIGVGPLPRRIAGRKQDSPFLARLDVRRNDVILAIDDQPFLTGDLTTAKAGPDRLRVLVLRDGARVALEAAASADDRATFVAGVALEADESLMLLPAADGAALAAGLRAGDRVLAVDGDEVHTWKDLQKAVQGAGEKPVQVRLGRPRPGLLPGPGPASAADLPAEDTVTLTITPRRPVDYDIGLLRKQTELREEIRATSFGQALQLGTVCSLDLVKQLYVTMKRLLTGEVGAKNLGGIIRISQVSYDAAQRGASWFWYFLALLSVNLAFVNLLPIPVLDGGHVLFLLIEKVKGSPVSTKVLGYSQVVGLVFVLLLVLFVTYNDILRLL